MDQQLLANRILKPLSEYYLRDNLEEIVMNRPEEIWVKEKRGEWVCQPAPELTYKYLHGVCTVLANINHARFSEDELPIVSCEIPGRPFRFQAIMGNNVRYELGSNRGIALAIRSLIADTSITLENGYGLTAGAKLPGSARFFNLGEGAFEIDDDHVEKIKTVIEQHASIIVSGATSTGKTTFTNRLIAMLHEMNRIVTVEDARELTVDQPNRVHLMVPRNQGTNKVGYPQIIDSLMRLTPDWVICGELSTVNAEPLYNLMGKGHPLITTVHAGTPDEAIEAFVNNMATSGSRLDPATTAQNLRSIVGCIIQLDRRDGKRKVVDIVFPMRDAQRKIILERKQEKARLDGIEAELRKQEGDRSDR